MFDIGFFELCVIGVVALLVLGPERLPRAARTAGMWVGRAKRMVSQVKRDIDDELRQEELQELREAKDSLSKTRESMDSFQKDLNQQVDTGDTGAKKKPSTSKPSASKPSASKPSASKPSTSKPSASKPSASKPSASKTPAPEDSDSGAPASKAPGSNETKSDQG